ncbi:MAG: asparagine synthase (glutamine-hydrolyzing) [bacterium]|nr:asparagine synthase (glutamine-hydrolyzing) [bacterium]
MCGICGLYTSSISTEIADILPRMNQALTHRGPDEAGHYYHRACGIAMRRLSIIDVAGGHQPIFNEDKQLVIVFNGEIYNFQTLQKMLRDRGHLFQTQTDTEVIVHLYEDEAESTPEFLKGMFAFCIYDHRDDSLFIARDRFGEKPLYYHCNPQNAFVFSSEIKSLVECSLIPRRLDYEALGYYMRVGFVPAPLTMFKDIRILPPGHWLKWRAGQLEIRPYYSVDYRPDPTLAREADAIEAVRATLQQAVARQAISDVPLGAFLSGGIDSSSVVAMLQTVSTRPVKTFTMRFEEESYDEGNIARQVAQHLGTDHHEFVVPNVAFEPDDFWRIVEHVGLPFLDTSAIPTYILSKHIRQRITVALSGDGGDEMFAGYDLFQWGLAIRRMQRLPQRFIGSSAWIANWLSQWPILSNISGLRRIRRGLKGASSPHHLLPIEIHALFELSELNALLRCENVLAVATGDLPLFTELPPQAEDWSCLRQLMYYRLKHTLHDKMLTKVDRMSMAASIEVRAPMLDVDLAELSMRLPDEHLIQNGVGKSVLRKAMRGKIPDVVFTHPKTGFNIPLHRFQNHQYKAMACELLRNRGGIMQLFSQDAINETIRIGICQQSDKAVRSVYRASHQLWGLMQLAAWQKRFKVSL